MFVVIHTTIKESPWSSLSYLRDTEKYTVTEMGKWGMETRSYKNLYRYLRNNMQKLNQEHTSKYISVQNRQELKYGLD